ncbi:CotH kinase family protein [Aureispira anguillae]|uniref:CotH kinase family protein n=1 Tax=Aureispira anguillae TaxID=2864201 RepID=A0A915YEG3_9BACT|nr:CotH kinase family protein [Aureispira anguillae]BDS11609.1 CotH kinase family protein [Aureispira anguillae]
MNLIVAAIILSIVLHCSSCKKDLLDKLAYNSAEWEDRPEGIMCWPEPKNTTLENGELSFNANHMHCIMIQMHPDHFKRMRNESRFGPSIQLREGDAAKAAAYEYLNECDVAFPSYYNWYKADLIIDEVYLPKVGLRKKGFLGSIFSSAPSLKIKIDKYEQGQFVGDGGSSYITLNNNSEDPSRIIQCLMYKVFEWANYPAPRCNLANVSINDEALGVYSHIEAIDRHFLQRNFGNNSGDLYEGQLTDFKVNWLLRWEPKNSSTDKNKRQLHKIARIIEGTRTKDLFYELNKYINVRKFIRFWALEVLLGHMDGYTRNSNNVYIYFDPNDNDRATFIPWGMNYFDPEESDEEVDIREYVTAELPRRLSRTSVAAALFKQEMESLLEHVWNENKLLNLIDHFKLQVESGQEDPYYSYSVHELKKWVRDRREMIEDVCEEGLPRGTHIPNEVCHFE